MAVIGLYGFAPQGLFTNGNIDWGILLAVMASGAFVVMSYSARDMARARPGLVMPGLGLLATAAVLVPAVLILSPIEVTPVETALLDPHVLILLFYLGVGPTALAYLCFYAGMARCRSALAGLIASMVEPALAALLAAFLLNELISDSQRAGCLLLALAVVLLRWGDQKVVNAERKVALSFDAEA